MTQTHGPRRRPPIVAAALAAIGVAVLAAVAIAAGPNDWAAGTPDRGSAACHHANEPAAELTTKQLRKAVRCLANEERAVRALGKLKRVRSLQKASQKHARAMAKTDCLAHRCPHEDDLETRLRKAGYFEGARNWRYAENTGCGLSAQAMFSNWMASTYHRINIVEEEFREIGVGVVSERVKGRCKKGYATFAAVFGRREGL